MTHVLVLGGNGFVGRALCKEAIRRGWTVTSLGRSGPPPNSSEDPLLRQVKWRSGNALDPSIYPPLLSKCDFLVHSIGILFESSNATYKALIRDTTKVAANAAVRAGIKSVGYVSAARHGALGRTLMSGYMQMKGEAEQLLLNKSEFRCVIARPGFIYGNDRWATIPLSYATAVMTLFTAGLFPRSLSVEQVAKAMINELEFPSAKGHIVMEVDDIFRIANTQGQIPS